MAYNRRRSLRFEWDLAKDEANQRKHGVAFSHAAALFTSDVEVLEICDEAHSGDEERFIAIGPIRTGLVVLVYTEPEENVIRIVSARRATRREARRFVRYWRGQHGA